MRIRFTALLLLCCCVIPLAATRSPAEQSMEDLLKKSESSTSLTSPHISIPQIPLAAPAIPRVDQPKVPAADKVKLATEDQTPVVVNEVAVKEMPPSALEKLITSDDTVAAAKVSDGNQARSLAQFGYSYFKNTSFAPQLDVPVSADYLVGPGDNLVVSVWGSIEGTYDLTVSRSGEIVLPKVGPIKVAGVHFGKLPEVLRLHLTKVFRDFNLAVNMGKLRTIKVYVVGEVNAPGDYTASSLATVINALSAAGGPTKNGTLRDIRLRRASGAEEIIDLYDFFTRGDKARDVRLYSGDTIFVPVIGKVAAIAGNVKRPAIYELKGKTSLRDLLALAEGVTTTGYLQRVQISRVTANEKKNVIDLNLDPAATGKNFDDLTGAVLLQDLDVVRVFSINSLLRNHFKVEGHVERPGFYALQPGMRISSVLSRDNLLPEYAPTILELTRLCPPDLHPEMQVLDLSSALAKDPIQDLELREFDTLRVFSRWELEELPKVRITGEVLKPDEYRLYDHMTVRDLLLQGGGFKPSAYRQRADLVRLVRGEDKVRQEIVSVNLAEALKGNPEHNLLLKNYDELLIRRLPDWTEEKDRYVTLTGEVVFPGKYPVGRGERLSSVIERAGGFTEKAYPQGAKFTRRALQEEQQKRMDEMIARTEQNILKKQGELATLTASKEELEATKASLEGLMKGLEKLKAAKAEGRMVIHLAQLATFKNSTYDVELEGGDALLIPRTPLSVNVLGQVYNSTSFVYARGKSVSFYLDKAGGPTSDAEDGEMYIVKMDGTVVSRQQTSFGFHWDDNAHTWNFGTFLSTRLEPGDTLIVPQKLERIAWMREIKDITTILSQIALTAGVMVAAGL